MKKVFVFLAVSSSICAQTHFMGNPLITTTATDLYAMYPMLEKWGFSAEKFEYTGWYTPVDEIFVKERMRADNLAQITPDNQKNFSIGYGEYFREIKPKLKKHYEVEQELKLNHITVNLDPYFITVPDLKIKNEIIFETDTLQNFNADVLLNGLKKAEFDVKIPQFELNSIDPKIGKISFGNDVEIDMTVSNNGQLAIEAEIEVLPKEMSNINIGEKPKIEVKLDLTGIDYKDFINNLHTPNGHMNLMLGSTLTIKEAKIQTDEYQIRLTGVMKDTSFDGKIRVRNWEKIKQVYPSLSSNLAPFIEMAQKSIDKWGKDIYVIEVSIQNGQIYVNKNLINGTENELPNAS